MVLSPYRHAKLLSSFKHFILWEVRVACGIFNFRNLRYINLDIAEQETKLYIVIN